MLSYLTHIECPRCSRKFTHNQKVSVCLCGSPLLARYDLNSVREVVDAGEFPSNVNSMWRYSQLLPVKSPSYVFSLGEGWTPLIMARRLGKHLGLKLLRIKDEGRNPTLSFKDRGLCVAVSKHVESGSTSFAIPSAGNAAVSMSAYCATAGTDVHVFMPADTPLGFIEGCKFYGANITLVEGNIADAARMMKAQNGSWTDLSTTKEPYRVEGKKTMAFEIAEQLNWKVPDVIICPTGGGTSIIGLWKGFNELEAIGLIDDKKPRLYAAQSEGCAPVVRAYEKDTDTIEPWLNGQTRAYGLRVPRPFADRLIMIAMRKSHGGAVGVAESEIDSCRLLAARMEGIDLCPEGAVGLGGLRNLIESGQIDYNEDVLLLNTGSSCRYGFPLVDA